ncbi:hypothetical protein [Sulfitobacter sp. PS-8MA]|uniref:hypothetical protein n=1 Tax=Sulfitobacter sp. PS-8MA TaxID=3237707 RepID=UPI0034C68AE5
MTTSTLDNPSKSLDNLLSRIGKSLNNAAATSSATARLREEAMKMVKKIDEHAEASRDQMLDPLLPRAQIEEAKRNAEAASVDSQRLKAAIELLQSRAEELLNSESAAKAARRYQAAQEQRDKVSAMIADRYPALSSELVTLIEEIMKANAMVDRVNSDLPEGSPPLNRPEGHARGFHDHGSYDVPVSLRTFRITQSMLPSMEAESRTVWPLARDYEYHVLERGKVFSQKQVQGMFNRS